MKARCMAWLKHERAALWPYIAPTLVAALQAGATELGTWHPSNQTAVLVMMLLSLAAKALVMKLRAVPPPAA